MHSVVVQDLRLQHDVELLSVQELVGEHRETVVGSSPGFLHQRHGGYALHTSRGTTARKELSEPRGDLRRHNVPSPQLPGWKLLLEGVLALVLGNRVSVNVELDVAVRVVVARDEHENGGYVRLVLFPLHALAASGGFQVGLHDHVQIADVGVFDAVGKRGSEFEKHCLQRTGAGKSCMNLLWNTRRAVMNRFKSRYEAAVRTIVKQRERKGATTTERRVKDHR